MISLKKVLLEGWDNPSEPSYSEKSTQYKSGYEAGCVRGAKTKPLTQEEKESFREIMTSNPSEEVENKIKNRVLNSMIGFICNKAVYYSKINNIPVEDLYSAGIMGALRYWPNINWNAKNSVFTYLGGSAAFGGIMNYINKHGKGGITQRPTDDMGNDISSLDKPVGDDEMSLYNKIGGSSDIGQSQAELESLKDKLIQRVYPKPKNTPETVLKYRTWKERADTLKLFLDGNSPQDIGQIFTERGKPVNFATISKYIKEFRDTIINNPQLASLVRDALSETMAKKKMQEIAGIK
jgi:hypothetical protein